MKRMAQKIMEDYAQDKKGLLTDDDYTQWCLDETRKENTERRPAIVTKFLRLLFQLCHVVFGLRPHDQERPNSHRDELVCVTEWQQRDSQR